MSPRPVLLVHALIFQIPLTQFVTQTLFNICRVSAKIKSHITWVNILTKLPSESQRCNITVFIGFVELHIWQCHLLSLVKPLFHVFLLSTPSTKPKKFSNITDQKFLALFLMHRCQWSLVIVRFKMLKAESSGRNHFSMQLKKKKQYCKDSPAHFKAFSSSLTGKTFQSFSWWTPITPLTPDFLAQATPTNTPVCKTYTEQLHQVGP